MVVDQFEDGYRFHCLGSAFATLLGKNYFLGEIIVNFEGYQNCAFCCSMWVVIFADLVVVSAGDDRKISLWHKNGQSLGTIPVAGTDSGDNIEVM